MIMIIIIIMCLQSVEYAEKVMRQIAILYRNLENLLKSKIDVVGTTRWRRWVTVTRDEKYYNHEPQPVYECTKNKLLWDLKIQTDNKIEHNKADIMVLDKIERKWLIIDVACPSDARVKDKRERKSSELPRPQAGVETNLAIAQCNCGASHNWCIRNCLERHRKVVSKDWCHIQIRSIAESMLTGYSQNASQS